MSPRIRFTEGEKVLVVHNKKYWAAKILRIGVIAPPGTTPPKQTKRRRRGKRVTRVTKPKKTLPYLVPATQHTEEEDVRCYIHYEGWNARYDEVVGLNRVAKRPGWNRNVKEGTRNLDSGASHQAQVTVEPAVAEEPQPPNVDDGAVAMDVRANVESQQNDNEDVSSSGDGISFSGRSSSYANEGTDSQVAPIPPPVVAGNPRAPVASGSDSDDSDEVEIVYTRGFDDSGPEESEGEDQIVGVDLDYIENVPRYLRELLYIDGQKTLKGESELTLLKYKGSSVNNALTQYVRSCKVQKTPGLMDIKLYVIQLRACMFKEVKRFSLFMDTELVIFRKIRGFARATGKDILDILPAIMLLRLFCLKGTLPREARKESHLALLQFLLENADGYFPYLVKSLNQIKRR